MISETITWHPVGEQLPDDDTIVLLFDASRPEPIEMGFKSDRDWFFWVDGDTEFCHPSHWADMPAGPFAVGLKPL